MTEPMINSSLSNVSTSRVETLEEMNERYASAMTPFAVIIGIFFFIGIFGNTIVIAAYSFSREYKNTNYKLFVICIAVIDLLSCVCLLPAEILKSMYFFAIHYSAVCKAKCFLNVFFMTVSALVLLVICIDRYRKVCQPLKPQIRPGLALKIIAAVHLFSFLVSLPAPVMCGIQNEGKENMYGTITEVYVCSAEEEFQKHIIRYVYKFGMSIMLIGVTLCLITLYVIIIKTVVRHWKRRNSGEGFRLDNSSRLDDTPDNDNTGGQLELAIEENTPFTHEELTGDPLECSLTSNTTHPQLISLNQRPNQPSDLKKTSVFNKTSLPSNSGARKSRAGFSRSISLNSTRSNALRRQSSVGTSGAVPFKTLIWFILTLTFLLTYVINAGLSFLSTREHMFQPHQLVLFQAFSRLHYVNNIINPLVYALLDKRFTASCKALWYRCTRT
ncbi:hypothetical protein DPMN_010829 [Dreissena polymorpha]|uniref:G-protein coupled receptors family 1 profile domain-containing protein n=1 Tax=Dreissena polymorpha TaxID=45954 RepID=A0A9D4RZM7_DREPO|nr:hypothetical protein DPMN_010829 [Dreissena polymorpha]